jgi:thioredoxin 1
MAKLTEITDANFDREVLKAGTPFLLDCSAEWCVPCKAMAPTIEALATEYAGKIGFGTLDVEKSPKTPTEYRVQAVPTLLLFSGGKVVGQLSGAHPKGRIVELLKRAL